MSVHIFTLCVIACAASLSLASIPVPPGSVELKFKTCSEIGAGSLGSYKFSFPESLITPAIDLDFTPSIPGGINTQILSLPGAWQPTTEVKLTSYTTNRWSICELKVDGKLISNTKFSLDSSCDNNGVCQSSITIPIVLEPIDFVFETCSHKEGVTSDDHPIYLIPDTSNELLYFELPLITEAGQIIALPKLFKSIKATSFTLTNSEDDSWCVKEVMVNGVAVNLLPFWIDDPCTDILDYPPFLCSKSKTLHYPPSPPMPITSDITTSDLPKAKPYFYVVPYGGSIKQYRPNGSLSHDIGSFTPTGGGIYSFTNGDGPCANGANGKGRDGTIFLLCGPSFVHVEEKQFCTYKIVWKDPFFCY